MKIQMIMADRERVRQKERHFKPRSRRLRRGPYANTYPEQRSINSPGLMDIAAVHQLWAAKQQPFPPPPKRLCPLDDIAQDTEASGQARSTVAARAAVSEQVAQEALNYLEVLLNREKYRKTSRSAYRKHSKLVILGDDRRASPKNTSKSRISAFT